MTHRRGSQKCGPHFFINNKGGSILKYRLGILFIALFTFFSLSGFSSGGTSTNDPTPLTCDFQSVDFHLDRTEALWKKGYDKSRWQDKTPVKDKEKRAVKSHKFCLTEAKHRKEVAEQRDKYKEKFDDYRFRRLITPYEGGGRYWAIPYYIVQCESGGDYHYPPGAYPEGGAYGIIPSTWADYGGPALSGASIASAAKPVYQDIIAHDIWVDVGPSAWECA